MNSNYGKSGTSLNNFDFDLGIGTNRGGRSLNDQKNKSFPSYSYASSSTTTFAQSNPAKAPSWQPNKPSWTHQPAPSNPSTRTEIGGPASMVGDIFGKSWNAAVPSGSSGAGVGIANKNPNLFGDLVGSALGQNKGNSNAPLKSATPGSAPGKSAFSMGGVADSLPKTSNSGKSGGSSWSSGPFQNYGGIGNAGNNGGGHFGNTTANKGPTLGGPSIRSTVGANMGFGVGSGVGSSKDPFGSLVDFSTKPTGGASLNSGAKANATTTEDFAFGDFQNASKSTASSFSSNTASGPKLDSFASQNPTPSQSSGVDSFDMFFSSSSAPSGVTTAATDIGGNQQFSGGDDWGMDSAFGGADHDLGSTTELEGLPPPPPGVSASTAKNKGMDSHKQGQFADAIKWLSWAVILFEKAGDNDGTMDVLICRASCYKEVGEYKKAVADCTKVLDHDDENVAVLVQRALLYESMEKYRLGAEDLRTVMKLDPGNRVARSTIHRLTKMAE